jgi:ribose transport system ATP-binding protein
VRELDGAELTETNIIASALNIDAATPHPAVAGAAHA